MPLLPRKFVKFPDPGASWYMLVVLQAVLLLSAALVSQLVEGKLLSASSSGIQHNRFAMELFGIISDMYGDRNFVFSPLSIQICVALAYFGAEKDTAVQIRDGMRLIVAGSDTEIAAAYGAFLKESMTVAVNGPELKTANRIFINETREFRPEFNQIATKYFDAGVEKIKFVNKVESSNKINNWVLQQTNNKIKDLILPTSLDENTSAVLVNALYFKGLWEVPFSDLMTFKDNFRISETETVSVDVMYTDDGLYNYAEIASFHAKFLELPYENSDISMVFVLPNNMNELSKLERKLSRVNLNKLLKQLKQHETEIKLPKFKVEFDMDLKKTLQKLGIERMFSEDAEFGKLFTDQDKMKVSEVKHKAAIEVNEIGTEAAAATYMKISTMSLKQTKSFFALHPFLFIIRSSNAIFFMGRVAEL